VLYDSEKRYPLSRCPSVSATVTSRQKLVKIKEMLAKLLAHPAGTLNQIPPSVFNAFCRTCSRHTLTVRENEVVISLGKGVSVAAIALRLGITMKNVSHYKRSVMQKMNLTTNVEFYQYAHWFSGERKKAVTTGNHNG
jgi:DNA-binding NarL/FixJ family response regulator